MAIPKPNIYIYIYIYKIMRFGGGRLYADNAREVVVCR